MNNWSSAIDFELIYWNSMRDEKNYYALGRFHINKYATSSNGGLWDGNVIISCDETLLSSHTNWTTVFVPNCDGLTAMGSYLIIDKILLFNNIPVVPARGGAEVALKIYIYKTFLTYRTCMRRAPAKPVRACILRKWCPLSHVTFEAPLRTSHFSLHSSQSSHSTLHTARFPLHSPHFTLHSPHFTVHTSHFTVHTSHFTLHTSHFTLHTSHCTLLAPHFTLHPSSHLSSSHLIPAHLFSSHLFSYVI